MSNKLLCGKVALVTGGSSGIGKATALKFAREGAKVVIAARRVEQSGEVVKQLQALGTEALFVRADVTRPADIETLIGSTLDRFGRLDCAVNNAGISGPRRTPIADATEAQWDEVMNINLKGMWLCMKHEIPAMLANGGGAIVNVASIYATKPSDIGHGLYATSKHAVVGLTKSAAADYGQMGIRINAVGPGFTHTEMVDVSKPEIAARYDALAARHSSMNRLGTPEETANAIVWLCSPESSYVTGTLLAVDGGSITRMY
ncbi:MAG TPA: glucose 1-dehydrogenase [Steroidobacteraceae bacterium]|nr:glucose 1-dehydrogenase [Steroidobacteraceae bacterium]